MTIEESASALHSYIKERYTPQFAVGIGNNKLIVYFSEKPWPAFAIENPFEGFAVEVKITGLITASLAKRRKR